MELVTNTKHNKHWMRLVDLISTSEKMLLCSGWINHAGLKKILPALTIASEERNAKVTIYTNKKHTQDKKVIESLSSLKGVDHIIVDDKKCRYLHTKLYYFESGSHFNAIVGSANLTIGGLVHNDELSIAISGEVDSEEHQEISGYLDSLKCYVSNDSSLQP